YRETFPQGLLEQALVHFQIVPKDHVEAVGVDEFARNPVGSGPFSFASGTIDSQVTLRRNPDYWNGAPQLETLVFRMMPEPSTRGAALPSGEAQATRAVPGAPADRSDSAPGVSAPATPGTPSNLIAPDASTPPL